MAVPEYPTGLFNVSAHLQTDGSSTVNAADVNDVYSELNAIETAVGVTPNKRIPDWGVNSFTTLNSNKEFANVALRIQNVEDGAKTAHDLLVSNKGGSIITPSGNAVRGLVIKAATGQEANLLEVQMTESSTPITAINSSGYIVNIDGGSA